MLITCFMCFWLLRMSLARAPWEDGQSPRWCYLSPEKTIIDVITGITSTMVAVCLFVYVCEQDSMTVCVCVCEQPVSICL